MAYQITELAIDNVSWTPFVLPDDAYVVSFYNKDTANDLKFRTNSADSTTEIIVPAGQIKELGDYALGGPAIPRFPKNSTLGSFQSAAGTGPVKLEYGR